jgi:fumarate hydratase subunit alpha
MEHRYSELGKWSEDIVIEKGKVIGLVKNAVIRASTTFREDQVKVYENAIEGETNEASRWALESILRNAALSERKHSYPLCNDTGTPHLYVEIGENAQLPPGVFPAIVDGVRRGLRDLPARPMAVKGEPMERIEQTKGLYKDPGMLVPGPPVIENIPGRQIHITVIMLGGGPELRSKTYRIYHSKNAENLLEETTRWALEEVARLGCTPCVPAIGIGRTHYEATALMLRAMRYGRFDRQSRWETKIAETINRSGVGPIGLGGRTTALGAFLEIGPQRASGARIVCMRLGCCYDPRRATVTIE